MNRRPVTNAPVGEEPFSEARLPKGWIRGLTTISREANIRLVGDQLSLLWCEGQLPGRIGALRPTLARRGIPVSYAPSLWRAVQCES